MAYPSPSWPAPSRSGTYGACVVVVVGLLFTAVACFQLQKSYEATQLGKDTAGTVREVRRGSGKHKSWSSRCDFVMPDGTTRSAWISGQNPIGASVHALAVPDGSGFRVVQSDTFNLWGGPCIFLLVGVGAFAGGILAAKITERRYHEILWLIANGSETRATIIGINEKISGKKRRIRRWYLVVRAPSGKTYTSEPLTREPDQSIIGSEARLLIDPTAPDRFYFPRQM